MRVAGGIHLQNHLFCLWLKAKKKKTLVASGFNQLTRPPFIVHSAGSQRLLQVESECFTALSESVLECVHN